MLQIYASILVVRLTQIKIPTTYQGVGCIVWDVCWEGGTIGGMGSSFFS
jgi:hypothetical protein